jgi:hypothetical protein
MATYIWLSLDLRMILKKNRWYQTTPGKPITMAKSEYLLGSRKML